MSYSFNNLQIEEKQLSSSIYEYIDHKDTICLCCFKPYISYQLNKMIIRYFEISKVLLLKYKYLTSYSLSESNIIIDNINRIDYNMRYFLLVFNEINFY